MPHERGLIEEVFGIKVTDRYGCEEVSLIGCECEKHDGMHLNVEHLFIEFVREDGTSCRPGEPGRIVVTDLVNRAMPLIRYNVGDVVCPTERRCTCGRGLPLMEGVTGRVADFLVKRDGTRVAGVSLIENTLTQFPGLDQMQIIQNGYEEVVLRIVAGAAFKEEVILGLKRVFSRIFGDAIEVRIELVEEIAPEKSGKYRFSLCNIGAPWQG
jgi:phenylacetate-CoA ligase